MKFTDIEWSRLIKPGELRNPFIRGTGERPLRLTLHTASFVNLDPPEETATKVLKDLLGLPEIETVQDVPGDFPAYEIFKDKRDPMYVPVILKAKNGTHHFGADLNPNEPTPGDLELLVRTHISFNQDIFVTASKEVLEDKRNYYFKQANALSPTEAIKLIGLFLRSRDCFKIFCPPEQGSYGIDAWGFYWVLVRIKLPGMWNYFGALVQFDQTKEKNLLHIGQSILERCSRACVARDQMGFEYFKGEDSGSREKTVYHFDYLTLLLSGSFDAAAKVAWHIYKIDSKKVKERNASFRNKDFVDELKTNGAVNLTNYLAGNRFKNNSTLLYELRNTIHGAANPVVRISGKGHYITPFEQYREKLFKAAQGLGPVERWGMESKSGHNFLPYIYAVTLVSECLETLNEIISLTDISKLFPDGKIPESLDGPPQDTSGLFSPWVQEKVLALG